MITKINDIDIRIESIKRTVLRRIKQNAIAGTPSNPIDKLGWGGLTFDIEAYALSEAEFDDLMAEMYDDDVQLHVRVGWFYYAIVTKLSGAYEESDVDYFPFSASFKTEEPFAYSDVEHSISESITSNNQTFGGSTIQTYGNINAVPDITIIGSTGTNTIVSQTELW